MDSRTLYAMLMTYLFWTCSNVAKLILVVLILPLKIKICCPRARARETADAFTLFERFEAKIESYRGNIKRAAVELAKDWRTDKMLRRLEALLIIADKEHTFIISGTGDVIEPEDGVAAIGSGGPYAQAAAKALFENTNLPAREIVEKSMKIASNICIYTNENITIEEL